MAIEVTWFGHATWSVVAGSHRLLIDPFLDDNPTAPAKSDGVEADFIFVTHGHFDHIADVAKIAKPHRGHGGREFRDLRNGWRSRASRNRNP